MKNSVLTLILFGALSQLHATAGNIDIYVSPKGFDGAAGTEAAPLRTLEGAKNRLLMQLPAKKAVIPPSFRALELFLQCWSMRMKAPSHVVRASARSFEVRAL